MTEVVTSYAGSLLVVGLTICYVAGVPTPAHLRQLSRVILKPLLGGFNLITRVF
jgi:hypothetical protein